jgi:hypothetical protein
MRNKKAK